ncbi:hypothetical protein DFH09DRAFT_555565 [Mycena vulgaris]|nr:hypothetical protein DFH09DRAFT_555565 [Mycena vulgaris]
MNPKSSGRSDEGKHPNWGFAHTQVAKKPRSQQCLNRWQRALCRVLVQNHGVPRIILRDYFGCAQSTISKAVENKYTQPDRTEEDDEILSSETNFDEILKEFLKMKHCFPGKKSTLGGNQHAHSKPARRRSRGSKIHTVSSSPERKPDLPLLTALGSAHKPSTSKAPTLLSPLAIAHCATSSPGSFLESFVAEVPLDEGWYEKLKNAGFDENKLRRIAGLRTEKIEKFIEKTFPEMTAVARFLLVTAIEGLAIQL